MTKFAPVLPDPDNFGKVCQVLSYMAHNIKSGQRCPKMVNNNPIYPVMDINMHNWPTMFKEDQLWSRMSSRSKFAPVLPVLINLSIVCQVGPCMVYLSLLINIDKIYQIWTIWHTAPCMDKSSLIWFIKIQYVLLWRDMTNCNHICGKLIRSVQFLKGMAYVVTYCHVRIQCS